LRREGCTSIGGHYSPATGFVSVGDELRKDNLHSRWALIAGVSSATLLVATMAHAAGGPAGETVSGPSTPVSEVIVTAEKRPVNVQQAPMSIAVFTAKQRAIIGINDIQDFTNYTPGLTYSGQLDRPVIRGVARDTNNYLTDSGVAIYNDDLYSTTTFLAGRDDMLIDQVSVQLGPQGTLYGRNAIGGLINTISKKPTPTLTGEFRVGVGNYGYNKVEGTISGPITDNLSFRVSGYNVEQDQGYFKNLAGGTLGGVRHDPYGDFQLQYKGAHDDIWLDAYTFSFNGDRSSPGALIGTPTTGSYETSLVGPSELFFNPNFPYSGGAVPGSTVGMIPGYADNPTTNGNLRRTALSQGTDIHLNASYAFNFHWVHHFDGVDVKYVGGYSQLHYGVTTNDFLNGQSSITKYQVPIAPGGTCDQLNQYYGAGACAPLTVYPNQVYGFSTKSAWQSHELTFSSTDQSRLQWLGGIYYYDETDDNPQYESAPGQAQLATPLNPDTSAGAPNPSRRYLVLDYQDRIQSIAGYAQLDYKITDAIKLTGGVRYTYDKKTALEESRYIAFGPDLGGGINAGNLGELFPAVDITALDIDYNHYKGVTCAPYAVTSGQYAGDWARCLGDSSSAVTGTVGVEWTPDRDTLAYLRYNRGYKAFGLNAGYIGSNPEAAPEFVDDIELGFKKTFGDTFQINANAFYFNYQNQQVSVETLTSAAVLSEFINVPKSISDGVELTAIWTPVPRLNLSLMYAFNDTHIESGCKLVNGVPTGFCVANGEDPYAVANGAQPVDPVNYTGIQSVKGNPLPQSPRNKLALNGNYTWVFDPGELTFSTSFIWKDASHFTIFTSNQLGYAPSWDQVDMRATWSGDHDRYEVVLYVKNLFDSIGYDAAAGGAFIQQTASTGGMGFNQSYDLTPPRLFGAELHYKF
jgi:iron complex outermembrane receptor protein